MYNTQILILFNIFVFLVEGNQTAIGYWTQWHDEDNPRNGIGDTETKESIQINLGRSVCDTDYSIYATECRTHVFDDWLLFTEKDAYMAPDKLHVACTKNGLKCRNIDQPMEATCRNYEVRFFCIKEGKDRIIKDSSSMIALAAGLTFLCPILMALIINMCKRYVCIKTQPNQLPITSTETLSANQQALFDPPPSYNFLFGNNQMSSSSEHLLPNQDNNDAVATSTQNNHMRIHTLPSSNLLPTNSAAIAGADNCYSQFRERAKRLPGMHLSVIDMYHQYYDTNSTPPPSYNDALVIIATVPEKTEER